VVVMVMAMMPTASRIETLVRIAVPSLIIITVAVPSLIVVVAVTVPPLIVVAVAVPPLIVAVAIPALVVAIIWLRLLLTNLTHLYKVYNPILI
jgi:hypothetical protein